MQEAKLELGQELASYLSAGVAHTFGTMIGLTPQAGSHEVRDTIELPGDISGVVNWTYGDINVCCIASFSSDCIFLILSKIYSKTFTELDDSSVKEGVAEVTNIIFGVIKSQLSNVSSVPIKMGIPKVIIGEQHMVLAETKQALFVPFTVGGQRFMVVVAIN